MKATIWLWVVEDLDIGDCFLTPDADEAWAHFYSFLKKANDVVTNKKEAAELIEGGEAIEIDGKAYRMSSKGGTLYASIMEACVEIPKNLLDNIQLGPSSHAVGQMLFDFDPKPVKKKRFKKRKEQENASSEGYDVS